MPQTLPGGAPRDLVTTDDQSACTWSPSDPGVPIIIIWVPFANEGWRASYRPGPSSNGARRAGAAL